MKDHEILNHLLGTPFLSDIIETMRKGNIIRPLISPVCGENIQTLGEMTFVEKVLYTISARCVNEKKFLSKSSSEGEPGRQEKLADLQDRADIAFSYLLKTVTARLYKECIKMNYTGKQKLLLSFHSDFSITFELANKNTKPETKPRVTKEIKKPITRPSSFKISGNKILH